MDHQHLYSEVVLQRLHKHAQPYESPNATVLRVLEQLEDKDRKAASLERQTTDNLGSAEQPRRFEFPATTPNLAHTKLQTVAIDDQPLVRPKWNSLMAELCIHAIHRHDLQWMIKRKAPRVVPGRSTTGGFHYLKSVDASVQYTDSTKAWGYTASLAEELGVGIQAAFFWRDKAGAEFPGEHGVAIVRPQER